MAKENKDISIKNTKEQILVAYNDAMEQVKNKPVTPLEEKAIIYKTKQVEDVKQYGYDRLNNQLNQIGGDFLKSLSVFGDAINTEYNQFIKLQNAIEVEQQHLNDLYAIKDNANTLSAVIIAHEKEINTFTLDMKTKEIEWENKLAELENEYKTKKIELEKQRKREEDEFTYTLTQKRRVDTDKYEQQKQELLRELSQKAQDIEIREKSIAHKEQEFIELQSKVINLESDIQTKIKTAESEPTKALQQEFKYTQALKEEQAKRNIELLQQKIESLQQKITEQDAVAINLNTQLQTAQEQSQKIAHKALETSIQRNLIINPHDNQAKNSVA